MSRFSDNNVTEDAKLKIKKETEEAFKMLEERLERQRMEQEEDTITAEILYLQHNSLKIMAKRRLPTDTLRSLTYDGLQRMRATIYGNTLKHKCSSDDCNFLNIKKGTKFIDPMSKTMSEATGLIYVCVHTGTAHTCGPYCNSMSCMGQGEGFSCTISGMVSNNRIGVHKLGGYAEGKCHFVNQNDEINNSQDIVQTHNDTLPLFDPEMDKKYYRVENSLQDARLVHNMVKNKLRANNNNNEDTNKRKRKRRSSDVEFCNREGDEYGFFSRVIEPPKKKRKKRNGDFEEEINSVNSKGIQNILEDFLYPANKEEINRSKITNKEKEAELEINNYYKKCVKDGKPPLLTDIMAIHAEKTISTYEKTIPKILSVPRYMDDINYFTNCLIHLWDLLKKTPFAINKKLNFQVCTVALLYLLKDGYCYDFDVDDEGRVLQRPTKTSRKESVILIPRHPSLAGILINETDIKKLHKSTSRNLKVKKKRTRRNNYKNVSLLHGKKEIGKCFLSTIGATVTNISEAKKYMLSSYMNIRSEQI